MGKRLMSIAVDGILSGFIVCIGCCVYMNCESKVLGAILFSFGLFVIIVFRLGLFTGKAGYMVVREKSYVIDVFITLAANFAGAVIGGGILRMTRFREAYMSKAADILIPKFHDSLQSSFVLAFFCGVLMYVAVEGFERCAKSQNYIGTVLAIIMPVMIFVFCNFNHCIADFTFFSISKFQNAQEAVLYFPAAIAGNALGGMLFPLCKKLSVNK